MRKLKTDIILCVSILFLLKLTFVQSVCFVKYPNNIEISPIYRKVFGKYKVDLPYNGNGIELAENETIEGVCPTSFSSLSFTIQNGLRYHPSDYKYDAYDTYDSDDIAVSRNQTSIQLKCLSNKLYYNKSVLHEQILECTKLDWTIYDTNDTYEWCEKNENSKTFVLATKYNQVRLILAGICYNLNELSLQTITYNITKPGQKYNVEMLQDIMQTPLKSFQSLNDDLWNLKIIKKFTITQNELQQQLLDLSETNSWLFLANYEISSLVQGVSYTKFFNEYIDMTSTLWWRNLRLGNWKLFMNTLENYAYNNSFQIYTGTSGVVKIPTKNMKDSDVLEIKNGYKKETVPEYIWSYLTSTDDRNEDFIIVSYNSPYAEFFNLNDIIFCPNICSEISWLKDIHSSFNFATAGITFCCSPYYMRDTIYLHGFPMDILMSRTISVKQSNETEVDNDDKTLLNDKDSTETNRNIVNDRCVETMAGFIIECDDGR